MHSESYFRELLKSSSELYASKQDNPVDFSLEILMAKYGKYFTSPIIQYLFNPSYEYEGSIFITAMKLSLDRPEFTYYEGFSFLDTPLHSGWCLDEQGNVVHVEGIISPDKDSSFLGLPISQKTVISHLETWVKDPFQEYYFTMENVKSYHV